MKQPKEVYNDPNYKHSIFQFDTDFNDKDSNASGIYITKLNENYGIISYLRNLNIAEEIKEMKFISYLIPQALYTLQDISPIEAANIPSLQLELPLSLTGKGVLIGTIDSGIDYTNLAFVDESGNTRIDVIYDQNADEVEGSQLSFGRTYSKEEINEALKVKRNGGDPYSIVPSTDEINHGTSMAALIGGRFKSEQLRSVAPDCTFAVVKLKEDVSTEKNFNATKPIYNIIAILAALDFLYKYAIRLNIPIVIYLPLGSNFGNHSSNGLLEEFIDEISLNNGIVVVTGAGNEGDVQGHTSGVVNKKKGYKDIQLYVSKEQRNLRLEIWVAKPNLMNLSIISPSGQNTGIIPGSINEVQNYKFIFENTEVVVYYYVAEQFTGNELILVELINLQPGTWIFRLKGEELLDGVYNAWIPVRGVTIGDTRFISPDPYGTMTTPGASAYIITAANYNQNNNNIVNSSGMAFLENVVDMVDVAAGGIRALTIDNLGKEVQVSGTSVSAAVVAGACALLLQWGIIDGNDKSMYAKKIKTYLTTGTEKRPGDIYPNAEWGYGVLDMVGVFRNMT